MQGACQDRARPGAQFRPKFPADSLKWREKMTLLGEKPERPQVAAIARATLHMGFARAGGDLHLVMMGSRPILPDIGLEATPEQVSEAVLELALELVSKGQEMPGG
jgi:hypothetical protein